MFPQYKESKQQGRDAERDVDVEDPAPADPIHQESAQNRTKHGRHLHRHAHDGRGPSPLLNGEDTIQHGRAHRRHHAATNPLNDPEDGQRLNAPGTSAQRRAQHEQRRGRHKCLLGAEPVPNPSGSRNPDGKTQQIAGDGPLQHVRTGVKLRPQFRQRYVQDGAVQDLHEEPEHIDAGDKVFVLNTPEGGRQFAHESPCPPPPPGWVKGSNMRIKSYTHLV